jgi:hypothetical protein
MPISTIPNTPISCQTLEREKSYQPDCQDLQVWHCTRNTCNHVGENPLHSNNLNLGSLDKTLARRADVVHKAINNVTRLSKRGKLTHFRLFVSSWTSKIYLLMDASTNFESSDMVSKWFVSQYLCQDMNDLWMRHISECSITILLSKISKSRNISCQKSADVTLWIGWGTSNKVPRSEWGKYLKISSHSSMGKRKWFPAPVQLRYKGLLECSGKVSRQHCSKYCTISNSSSPL